MAGSKVKMPDAEARSGKVALRVPIDGRLRTILLAPDTALLYANHVAGLAADMLGPVEGRLPVVDNIKFLPTEDGGAHLQLITSEGPCLFHLPAEWLVALTQAAGDLLELRGAAGSA